MAVTVFPESGDSVTETTWQALSQAAAGGGSHIVEGFDVTYDGAGLDIDVAAGVAFIEGYRVESDAAQEVTGLTASDDNYIWLLTDGTLEATLLPTYPGDALCLAKVTTDGSSVTAVSADVPVTSGRVLYVGKAADESVASSTTLQDDDELTLWLEPGVWRITLGLKATWTTNNGFKLAFTSSATNDAISAMVAHGGTSGYGFGVITAFGSAYSFASGGAAGTNAPVVVEGTVALADAGTLTLQFAQATSHADSTTIKAGSFLVAERVG